MEVEHRVKILEWLSPPEHSPPHLSACDKQQPGTGDWFIQSSTFHEWQHTRSSRMWLYGKGLPFLVLLYPQTTNFYY